MVHEDIVRKLEDLETRLASAEARHTALVTILEKELDDLKTTNASLSSQISTLSANLIVDKTQ